MNPQNPSKTPDIWLISGALSIAEQLQEAAAAMVANGFDVTTSSLPGHGSMALPAKNDRKHWITALANQWRLEVPPDLIIGESLAGNLALWLPAHFGKAIPLVLIDPPLYPAKLWHIRQTILANTHSSSTPIANLANALNASWFGYSDASLPGQDWSYFSNLADVASTCPILILTGDYPLWPIRQSSRCPCLLDGADRFLLSTFPNVTLHAVTNADHVVLRRQPTMAAQIIRQWYQNLAAWAFRK